MKDHDFLLEVKKIQDALAEKLDALHLPDAERGAIGQLAEMYGNARAAAAVEALKNRVKHAVNG